MFKIIAICLLILIFIFNIFIDILNYRNRNTPVPDKLKDVYDDAAYLKWKNYSSDKIKVDIFKESVSFVVILLLIIFNVFSLIANKIDNMYLNSFVIISIFIGIDALISLPFNYIDDIKIEGKYGFNKSSLKTFIFDQIKSFIIEYVLLCGLLMLVIVLYNSIGDFILLLLTGIIFAFSLLISFLFPYLSKAFNKFTPLEEGELKDSLIKMLESHGYHVKDIKVMDASRRTTKSNAYFTGYGKTKTIVLYDNLLKTMSNEQIVAIFAHEMGHGLHKDTLKSSFVSLFGIIIFVLLAWLLIKYPSIYTDFGFNDINYAFGLILLMSVILPLVMIIFGIISNLISRHAEYKADEQAYKEGYGDTLIDALKVLYKEDLGDLSPHPLIVILSYSHPTLLQRMEAIEKLKENN